MDPIRQIRFLIPPFFFYASLLWGVYWSDPCHNMFNLMFHADLNWTAIVGFAVAMALPVGFLIGTLTHVFLIVLFRIKWPEHDYDFYCTRGTLLKIFRKFRTSFSVSSYESMGNDEKKKSKFLTLLSLIQGELFNKCPEIFSYATRVWTAYILSANSAMSLFLAPVLGFFLFGVGLSWHWLGFTFFLLFVFIISVFHSHKRTFQIVELAADLELE